MCDTLGDPPSQVIFQLEGKECSCRFCGFYLNCPSSGTGEGCTEALGLGKVSVSRGQETLACSVLRSLDVKKNKMLEKL